MQRHNANPIWSSPDELAGAIQSTYSVTGADAIRRQYHSQVKQYPLYLEWFDRIARVVSKQPAAVDVLEYGPGPGILAGMLARNAKVKSYTAIEPESVFRDMTLEETCGVGTVIDSTGEEYRKPGSADLVIATATYHHFHDKPRSLANIKENLRSDGKLILTDGFIPPYEFDKKYNPKNRPAFIEQVLRYAAAQVLAMPKPSEAEIIDQIKTAFLDVLRIEELKVCFPILIDQMKKAGFSHIEHELMRGDDPSVNYENLGYYFVTAAVRP